MAKKVDCECGVTLTAETDDDLYSKVSEHAAEVHQMDITREQALAMAKPA